MRYTRHALLIAMTVLYLVSCKKDKENAVEIAEASAGGNVKTINLDYLPGNETITAITLKNSGSNGSVHVKLAMDDAAVTTAATKKLAAGSFTITTLEYDIAENSSVNVPVTIINRSAIPLDTSYAIGFKIETVSGGNIVPNGQSIVVKFDLRNKLDGRYRVTGTFTDIAAPTITHTDQDVAVITTSPTQVKLIPKDLGIEGYLILSGTSLSYYGSFGPVFNFNPTNNKIVSVVNYYGQPASNTRSAEIDPTGSNQWDPATKSIIVKYFMKQPNTVVTPPYIRVFFTNTLIYLGPRYK